ncbi:hypothetical protein F5Y16DRAFT_164087 [Xylariaceae sp. FL0255]|nr:hypothetical protein F5Y16DRAFT_164087 [Xylariaceae sp. FL0255]
MSKQQAPVVSMAEPTKAELSMQSIWDEAEQAFQTMCGKSLLHGPVMSFQDVTSKIKIESASKATHDLDPKPEQKRDLAKRAALKSLGCLKVMVKIASEGASFVPFPQAATSITCNALCFIFDIPSKVKGYDDAVNGIFEEVSSTLSQFEIYRETRVEALLLHQIQKVMVSFVKLCAHVVQYGQGGKRNRIGQQLTSIFDDKAGFQSEMDRFKLALQQQRDVEGTVTLATTIKVQEDSQVIRKAVEGNRTLSKIRDALHVPSTVHLDTRTTQTCTDIFKKLLPDTGNWLLSHPAFTEWSRPQNKDSSHVLVLSGPPSSGKTLASSFIIKHLEDKKGRTYVAHYFFPTSTKSEATSTKSEARTPVQSALRYMAFQLARVDPTVLKRLGDACDTTNYALHTLTDLNILWDDLKIGDPGSGAVYYLAFDGLENLDAKDIDSLLHFIHGPKLKGGMSGLIRVLVSGTDRQFASMPDKEGALRIKMEENNISDMRMIVTDDLDSRGLLKNTKPNSPQKKAREAIIEKVPRNSKGSYSALKHWRDEVLRLLSTRTSFDELNQKLEQSVSSHEMAIKNLQQSLSIEEIKELNELLGWVLFSRYSSMYLDQLESALNFTSGTESLAPLETVIREKYNAVLKVEDSRVSVADGVGDHLIKDGASVIDHMRSRDQSTISMTIDIQNVDQEICGHFLWDLAHTALRDKFKFDFTASSNLLSTGKLTIGCNQLDAHRTIVTRTFEYLGSEPKEETEEIGLYLMVELPYNLGRLRDLGYGDRGSLKPQDELEIGRGLYDLLSNNDCMQRHRSKFQQMVWTVQDLNEIGNWLVIPNVVRKLDKKWRENVQNIGTPTRGYLRALVKCFVEGFLRGRDWTSPVVISIWIAQFMKLDEIRSSTLPLASTEGNEKGSQSDFMPPRDWRQVSDWCQHFLGLRSSELDSLWFERLATAATDDFSSGPEIAISLFQCALEKANPSWLCHRGLGTAYFRQDQTTEAIEQILLALEAAKSTEPSPAPTQQDLMGLELLLGEYYYASKDGSRAARHYLTACESEDSEQVMQGQLGNIRSKLYLQDTENTRTWLKAIETGKESLSMHEVLRLVSRDDGHDILMAKMFNVAKTDAGLLQNIVDAMETVTNTVTVWKTRNPTAEEVSTNSEFAEKECQGVLLYDRGVAAYTYKISPKGTDPVSEACKLWQQCGEVLADVGGYNASLAKENASKALAKHYFQAMSEGRHLKDVDALRKLAQDEVGNYTHFAAGLLGSLYASLGHLDQSKKELKAQVETALQMLSDDVSYNDASGYYTLQNAFLQHQDFINAVISLSLCMQADLLTEGLEIDIDDEELDEALDKQEVAELVSQLVAETIKATKDRVPNSSNQVQRIEAASTHLDLHESRSNQDNAVDSGSGLPTEANPNAITAASRIVRGRLTALQQKHLPKVHVWKLQGISIYCNGATEDGRSCKNNSNFDRQFYSCLFCASIDFCSECLRRLRDPETEAEIRDCSARHQWLRMPPMGHESYVGPSAKTVRKPAGVRVWEGDDAILSPYYPEDGGEEINVEVWKEELARQWHISL